MSRSPLIDVATVHARLADPNWLVVDCRFNLADPGAGRREYQAGHVPGAVFADLERDLTGPPLTDHGRHPLPAPEALQATFGRLGIAPATAVVAYDASGAGMAARLWWLLRYMGHDRALVMDGGWPAWQRAGLPERTGEETRPAAGFVGAARTDLVVLVADVPSVPRLIDAREHARHLGAEEPIDPVAGRIPGSVNQPWKDNLTTDGFFRPPADLREVYEGLLGDVPAGRAAVYCGSGVTACHDALAMAHAGLPMPRVYAGSWSDWITDPARPVERG